MATFHVKAHWDAEACVWWAESDDVPGLVAEAETHEGLIAELRVLVPELLEVNLPDRRGRAQLVIVSDQVEELFAG